jgi:hypothetical protein
VLYACAAERCLRKALINATLTRRTDAHIAHPCSVLTSAARLPAVAGDVCCAAAAQKKSYAKNEV